MESNKTELEARASGQEKGEKELIEEARQNNSQAFDQLVLRYQDRVYHAVFRIVGNPEDSLDIVQDAFIKAFCSLKTFKGDSNFYTWIFRIAVNTSLTFIRKREKKQMFSMDWASKKSDEEKGREAGDKNQDTPSEILEKQDLQNRVHQALLTLNDEYRIVLILKDLEGLAYEKISAILEIPKGTVKSRIFRAREALKEKLKDLVP